MPLLAPMIGIVAVYDVSGNVLGAPCRNVSRFVKLAKPLWLAVEESSKWTKTCS